MRESPALRAALRYGIKFSRALKCKSRHGNYQLRWRFNATSKRKARGLESVFGGSEIGRVGLMGKINKGDQKKDKTK